MCFSSSKNTIFFLFFSFLTLAFTISWKLPPEDKKPVVYSSYFENILGTSFEMKVKTTSTVKASLAEKTALSEIQRLSKILSTYNSESEFSTWMNTQNSPFKASKELIEVLSLFDTWQANTNGALNPAFEVIGQLWSDAEKNQLLPVEEDLKLAVKTANKNHWDIDAENGTVTHLTNTPLKLNTFVKSYIIDKTAKKVMEIAQVDNVVINIGGDILVSGNQSELIEITNPEANAINDNALDIIKVENKFVATSGNYKRGYSINNQWYSHIIDPRTGLPANNITSTTVIANNASDAGALATALNILPIEESLKLVEQFPEVAFLIVDKKGKQITSNNWKTYQIKKDIQPSTILPTADQWASKYELVINLELAKFQGPYRRPFVAIWIEKEDKSPVRTLSVWYNKPRWIRDLKAWYRTNYSKFNVENNTLNSVSSATRPAGNYAIKWDGKDDDGNIVENGKYIINIEVAREHGTYQLITQQVDVKNKTQKIDLSPNTEVASASIEVKKK